MKDYCALSARYKNKGQFDKALQCLKKATTQQRRSLDPYLGALDVYLLKQDHEKANAQALRIYRKSPEVTTCHKISQIYHSANLAEQANRWGERCIKLDPGHCLSQLQQIMIYASTGQRKELSDYCAQIDTKGGEEHFYFWETICKSLVWANLGEQAKPFVKEALERFPHPSKAHLFHALLAHIAYREKNADEAMESMLTHKRMFAPYVQKESDLGKALQLRAYGATLRRVMDPEDMLPSGDAPGERLVYAIGPPRSGSTLLERLLDAHPEIVTLNEPNLAARILNLKCGNQFTYPSEALFSGQERMSEATAAAIGRMISAGIPAYAPGGVDGKMVIDKSPFLSSHVYLLAEVFPAVRFLATIRDPRDAAISYYLTHYFKRELPLAKLCETLEGTFRLFVTISLICHHLQEREPQRCHLVSYESLVNDPAETMGRCFAFLGLQDFDAVDSAIHGGSKRALNSPQANLDKGISKARKGVWQSYEKYFAFLTPRDAEALRMLGYE